MQESYREGIANHPGPEPCEGSRAAAAINFNRPANIDRISSKNCTITASKSSHLCANTCVPLPATAGEGEEVTVSPAPAVSGSFSAAAVPVGPSQPLTVSEFIPGQKPGNVAVCLSGGGSRALTAGKGQLNALQTVQYAPNMSLLSQAKALSTVSGGSWLGVAFAYLPPSVSDVNYLGGPYVQAASLTPASLGSLPSDCMGANITIDFTLTDMVVQAVLLYWEGVPADMLWQTIIALQLLAPHGLFAYTSGSDTPDAVFSYDQNALNGILKANPSLQQERANLVSSQPRPYLVCNTAMFVTANGQSLLAPVQATSFMSGIVSTPPGATDANGFPAGGGGVTSFAFNSTPTAFNASTSQVTVAQQRQWRWRTSSAPAARPSPPRWSRSHRRSPAIRNSWPRHCWSGDRQPPISWCAARAAAVGTVGFDVGFVGARHRRLGPHRRGGLRALGFGPRLSVLAGRKAARRFNHQPDQVCRRRESREQRHRRHVGLR